MSDQTPSLSNLGNVDGSNLINLTAGGGNIVSINGDNTAAQTLVGVGNCVVTDMGGGVHNINVALPLGGLTDINGDNTPSQVLAAGAGITIVDGGGGLHTISADVPAAILTLNGDATAAQVIAVGAGLTLLDAGNTHTISITAGAGLFSLNGDGTAAQVVQGGHGISVTDVGNTHTIDAVALQFAQTVSGGDNIPDNTPTSICPVTVPSDGLYVVSANVKFTTLPAVFAEYRIEITDDFAVSVVASQSLQTGAAVGTFTAQLNATTTVQATAGVGHTFSIAVTQISGGALVTSADLLTSLTLTQVDV